MLVKGRKKNILSWKLVDVVEGAQNKRRGRREKVTMNRNRLVDRRAWKGNVKVLSSLIVNLEAFQLILTSSKRLRNFLNTRKKIFFCV